MFFLKWSLLWKCVSSRNIKAQHWLHAAAFRSEISECCSTPQHSLCSSDPPDQSCTADLRLFSLFILRSSASTHFPPSASSLNHPPPSLPRSLLPFLPHSVSFFCFVTAHLRGDQLMLLLSEATLPEHCTSGNMQICFSSNHPSYTS